MADNPGIFKAPVTQPDHIVWATGWLASNETTYELEAVITAINITQGSLTHYDQDTGAVYSLPAGWSGPFPGFFVGVMAAGTVASVEVGNVAGASDLSSLTGSLIAGTYNYAEVHVYDSDGIVYTLDGTDPAGTAGAPTTGIRLNEGASFELESNDEINNFKFFNLGTGADAGIYVEIFTVDQHSGSTFRPEVFGVSGVSQTN